MQKIKILFFIETIDGGGAEKVLRNLVNNMDQSKFEITVQTVFPSQSEKLLTSGIRYKAMYPVRNPFYTMLYRLEAACSLSYPLRIKDEYDIECACLECGSTKILAGSTNRKALKLAWVHCDLMQAMPDPHAFAAKTARYYAKYDKVVCVSELCKRSFDELYGQKFETVIIHNTVDCEVILQNAQMPLPDLPDHPLVVSLGRLAAPKHYIRLLKAHKKLLEDGAYHNLLILGEGPDRPLLEKFVRENQLGATVRLPGYVENPYPYLKAADLLACSSIYECYSTFITEGLILGKPIVTTDVSGMRELLGDSQWGLITDNDDIAFYEGMKQLLKNPDLCQEYAEKAAARGRCFTTKKLVKETESFLVRSMR